MKKSVNITLDTELLKQIDKLRGLSKRSTFAEHLMKLGLTVYKDNEKRTATERRTICNKNTNKPA